MRMGGFGSLLAVFCIFLWAGSASAEEDGVKEVSGMSIMGNNETPKALYIVPWKASEIGAETQFSSSLLDEAMVPVDKPVFLRELGFYKISSAEQK